MRKKALTLLLLMTIVGVGMFYYSHSTATHTKPLKAKVEMQRETKVAGTERATVALEKEGDLTDSIERSYGSRFDFDKYSVKVITASHKVPLDFSSNPDALNFKTRIKAAYENPTVNFAGHYTGVLFGCGAGCIMGYIIDVVDGKIYDAPLGEENSCMFGDEKAICEAYSRLYISGICKDEDDSGKEFYIAYEWDETKKEFKHLDEKEFLKP